MEHESASSVLIEMHGMSGIGSIVMPSGEASEDEVDSSTKLIPQFDLLDDEDEDEVGDEEESMDLGEERFSDCSSSKIPSRMDSRVT